MRRKKKLRKKASEMAEKPTAAIALSITAGVLIILYGVFILSTTPLMEKFQKEMEKEVGEDLPFEFIGKLLIIFSIVGIIFGILVSLGGIMIYNRPSQSRMWGTVVLIFSILSIFGGGGFLVGMILGIIGGILAITWSKPKIKEKRTCLNCGRMVPIDHAFCPYCGKKFDQ